MPVAYRRTYVSLSLIAIIQSLTAISDHNSPSFSFIYSEKYVTKAEFDHLKARYEQLEALVRRYLPIGPSAPQNMAYYTMGVQPGMSGMVGDPVSSYSSGPSSMVYSQAMMPPPPQSQAIYHQAHGDTTQAPPSRYLRTEAAVAPSPTRHHFPATLGIVGSGASPIMSTTLPAPPPHRTRVVEGMASPVVSMKTSPLSLASITSPYHPDQPQMQGQQKNCRAQTLRLGERLRPGREDPTIFIDRTQRGVLAQPAALPQHMFLVKVHQYPPRHYQCLLTPSRLVTKRPPIGLGIARAKRKGTNGDRAPFMVDAIDYHRRFGFVPATSTAAARRKPRRRRRQRGC